MVRIRYWVQDTLESGHWEETKLMKLKIAEMLIEQGFYERAEILQPN